jgi:hypothetical protein
MLRPKEFDDLEWFACGTLLSLETYPEMVSLFPRRLRYPI